jgi:hypothetical protein
VTLALLAVATTALFLTAELLRISRPQSATLIALAGWILLVAATVIWMRAGRPRRHFWGKVARVAVLAAVAAAVLLLYLRHSRVLEAGTHVDAVYTWIGLRWVFELRNPVTLVGRTPSYPQSPMMLLSHLPGMAVGFDRLGPLAIHLGVLLTVSALLALMTVLLTPTASLGRQAAAVALAAGCLSTRFVVQGYDAVGYTIAGVSLGLALVAALAVEDEALRDRVVGALIVLTILHYSYVGLALGLPLCAAWLLARRHPIRATRAFVVANPILILVLVLLAIAMKTHPELALARAYDVVAGVGSKVPLQASLAKKLATASVWRITQAAYQRWCIQNQASWHLVDLAPLGGPSLRLVAAMWACSWIAAPRRALVVTAYMVGFVALFSGLSVLEHVVTDPADYRDFPLVFAVTAAGLLFILRAPALRGVRAAVAWGLAIVVAAVNFGDVPLLAGHRHASVDYAPQEVSVLEALRQATAAHSKEELGASVLAVTVADTPLVPIGKLYVDLFSARGFTMVPISTGEFCRDRDEVIRKMSGRCQPFLLAYPLPVCGLEAAYPELRGVIVLRYDGPCPANRDTGAKPAPSAMLLEGG